MAATLTIGTTTYPNIAIIEDQYDQTDSLQERGGLQLDIIDYVGTHFKYGEQVTVTDPVLGIVFDGFVNTDKERPLYPSGFIYHTLTCVGMHYLADKRTYTATYATSSLAGKIVVDILSNVLTIEGIVQNFAVRNDNDITSWSQGNLSNVIATTNLTTVPGDLELALSGSDMSISPDLSTGTFSNMQWTGSILEPTPFSVIKLVGTISQVSSSSGNSAIYATIWTGSIAVTTGMTYGVTVFVPSSNKDISATLDVKFSDSSILNVLLPNIYDQNQIPSYTLGSNGQVTDISQFAKDKWYTRTFTFPSAYNGKTAVEIRIGMGGSASGVYVAFYTNVVFGGTTAFGSNWTAFSISPFVSKTYGNFQPNLTQIGIFTGFDSSAASWISSSVSIASVDILNSSTIQYYGTNTNNINIYASYDGNSYFLCHNNSSLPNLPSGSVLTSSNLTLKVIPFPGSSTIVSGATSFGVSADPTVFPTISQIFISIKSAYNPLLAKSDIISAYGTTAQWNTGTFSQTTASGTDLTITPYTPSWTGAFPSGYSLFWGQTSGSFTVTQSVSSGSYIQTFPATGSNAIAIWAETQISPIGLLSDFTAQVTIKISSNNAQQGGILYRQTGWNGAINNSFGYYAYILCDATTPNITFGYGSNSNTGSDSFTSLASVSTTINANTNYTLKVVVSGNLHNIYLNGTLVISVQDSTYMSPGNIGFRGFGQNVSWTNNYSSFSVTPISSGSWTSPAISLGSLITCGGSSIAWTEVNTNIATTASSSGTTNNTVVSTIQVQISLDGGSTYTTCTNDGQIPGLSGGASLTGKNILIQISMSTISQTFAPIVRGLMIRVLGQYPGAIGIRTTAPLGNDTSITRTVGSGWGTAFDSQTWTQLGTGTTQVSSNTETIANTTGDVNMQLGIKTWTDQDCTIRFKLSVATIEAGITLRYFSSTSFYRLFATTTALTIIKNDGGSILTMNTVHISLATNTLYRMRFRIVGSGPITLTGNVWLDGTLEPTINSSNGLWNDANWIITTAE